MSVSSEPIRVLYIHGGIMLRGGTEAYMMNYYRNMDRTKIQVDFVVHGFEKGVYDDEIKALGGRIFNIPVKSKDLLGNIRALRNIFLLGDYKIVHAQADTSNAWILKIAKQCGVPVRISHSHSTSVQTQNKLKLLFNNYLKKSISKYATHLFACSEPAGKWLYDNHDFQIISNAIDLSQFSFNQDLRKKVRNELEIHDDDVVLGHVGRFSNEKNHVFLVDVINHLIKIDRHYKLVLIGDGYLKDDIQQHVRLLGIEANVRFIPACGNVNEYYNAFDFFCLPSLFEGLPVVGIEAQTNGLNCFVSDTVSRELNMTDNLYYLPIGNGGIDIWCKRIREQSTARDDDAPIKLRNAGYDIKENAKELSRFYLECLN